MESNVYHQVAASVGGKPFGIGIFQVQLSAKSVLGVFCYGSLLLQKFHVINNRARR